MVLDVNSAVQLHGPQQVCIQTSCHLNRNVLQVWWSKQLNTCITNITTCITVLCITNITTCITVQRLVEQAACVYASSKVAHQAS